MNNDKIYINLVGCNIDKRIEFVIKYLALIS